jgi:hypothetical protein
MVSTGGAAYYSSYLAASFAHDGDINGSPIYKDGDKWMAVYHKEGYVPAWVVSSTNYGVEPGSGSGHMYGKNNVSKVRFLYHFSQAEARSLVSAPPASPHGCTMTSPPGGPTMRP